MSDYDLDAALDRVQALAPSYATEDFGSAATPGAVDWFSQFLRSGVAGAGQLVGMEPDSEVLRWRRDNPVGGIGSQFLGIAVPYVGWAGTASRIPRLARAMDSVTDASRPIVSGAAREMVRFAPFEAGRLGVSQVVGDESFGDMAGSAAFNWALGGVFGGFAGALGAVGRSSRNLTDLVPGADPRAPVQLQLRQINQALATGQVAEQFVNDARRRITQLRRAVRIEEIGGRNPQYVRELEIGGASRDVNRLFRTQPASRTAEGQAQTVRRRLLTSSRDFRDGREWREAAARAGLPENFEELGQYFRHLSFTSDRAANNIYQSIQGRGALQPLGSGWYWGKEADDGLYVMARRVGQGKPSATDEWVVFKTDLPGAFVPDQARWANSVTARNAWLTERETAGETGLELLDTVADLQRSLPLTNYIGLVDREGNVARLAKRIGEIGGLNKAQGRFGFLGQRMEDFFREYFAPTVFQFNKSPRANWLWGIARSTFDRATANAQAILHGDAGLQPGSLWRNIWSGPGQAGRYKGEQALLAMRRELSDEDLVHVHKAWNGQWGERQISEALARDEFSDAAAAFLSRLRAVDDEIIGQIQGTQQALGKKLFTPLENHYMISRTWTGDWRVPIMNEGNEIVYMASGHTRSQAQNLADDIMSGASREDKNWRALTPTLSDRTQDLEVASQVRFRSGDFALASSLREQSLRPARTPRFFEERQGVGGFVGAKAPWTGQELDNILTSHVQQQQKYLADLVVRESLGSDLARLAAENPSIFRQLSARLDDLSGKPGAFAQMQNNLFDKILAPALGKNSATKIVRTANNLLYHLQLGGLNVAFPIINALTFMQTTLPQVSYVMSATPQRLARYYSHFPVAGSDGLPRGGVGALDMFKLMRQSFREMGKPNEVLRSHFGRGAAEGVWDPRFVEEFVGENAQRITKLRDVLQGRGGFVGWLESVSSFLPAQSEKFARGHSFVVGHILGRDFLGMADDQLYRFAKEFTNNTMFLYGTADRARLITGPLGSLFGMFKNWQMHYIGGMLEYTGEGVMRGNWAPLLWMTGGTASLGGMTALPLFGVANAFSEFATDQSLMQNTYEMFGNAERDAAGISDAVFLGLPSLLGVSLSGQAAAPFANPVRDASMLFSFVHVDRMRALGRAVGSSVDQWSATGEHPIHDDLVRDQFIRALAPKTVYRAAAAWEDNMIRSLSTGYPVLTDMSQVERMMYVTGLNPRYIELAYRTNDELWRDQRSMRNAVQRYGHAWAAAQESGDGSAMWDIMRRAMADGVDVSSVLRSANTRLAQGREDMIERQFSPEAILEYRRLGLAG